MKADLHMHTSLSDGKYTAEVIIKRAKRNGVDIISITDHDICKNVEENFKFAEEEGIIYLPGIELSTIYKRKPVHVLGYFKDDSYKSKEMLDYYTSIRVGREKRAVKFIENLKKYNNIEITYEEVYSYS
ncbi:MAG: PHP domain-containing protein, partial [Candidatus Izimaplasma sp.]|nr:PHP domain-containing protein [Candidatus Izimaplasma bacterium]